MMTSAVAEAVERENASLARNGGPAFPQGDVQYQQGGLTKREYMATHILAGLFAGRAGGKIDVLVFSVDAHVAAMAADALLAELAK